MAYNVFKRPMFKRGGSTTGTGIMSHVEPKITQRVNQQIGTSYAGLISPGMASEVARGRPYQTPTSLQRFLTRFPKTGAAGLYGAGAGIGIGLGALTDFYAKATKTPEEYKRLQEMSEFGIMDETNLDVGEALDYIKAGSEIGVAPGFFPRGGREKFYTDRGLDPNTGLPISDKSIVDTGALKTEKQNIEANEAAIAAAEKAALEKKTGNGIIDTGAKDDSTYKVSDLETTVKDEADFLRKLLKDEDYSKGELALVIAGAVKEPGGIAEKLDKARELSLPIARKRRQEDKAITLAAYKAAKEKEKYETRYGRDTDYIRNLKSQAKSLVGRKGYEDKTEDEIFQDLIASKTSDVQGREKILTDADAQIFDLRSKIIRKTQELNKPGTNERTKKALEQEIAKHKSDLQFFTNLPEFEKFYGKDFKTQVGLKYGGRVMKAVGGDVTDEETADMETSDNTVGMAVDKIGQGSGSQTVTEGVQRLSYQELRDRLPQEITDDVVNLLANSEEALQQFAYIRTQDDVNSFNAKYGVNLVIPPTRG